MGAIADRFQMRKTEIPIIIDIRESELAIDVTGAIEQ